MAGTPVSQWTRDHGGWIAIAGLAYAAGMALLATLPASTAVVQQTWVLPPVAAAAYLARRTSRQFDLPRARQLAWRLASMALLLTALSVALAAPLRSAGLTGAADAIGGVRLMSYPLLAAAAVLLMRSSGPHVRWGRMWNDGLVVVLSFGSLHVVPGASPHCTKMATVAPPWPPTPNKWSKSSSGPNGAFENGNIGNRRRLVPLDQVLRAVPSTGTL